MDWEKQAELDRVERIMDEESIRDWAAYKRKVRREREQRLSVMIVAVGLAAGLALLVYCCVAKARENARERAELIELIGGAK